MVDRPRIALFIDAENTSSRHAERCVDYCRLAGRMVIGRCYGKIESLANWNTAIADLHLVPRQTLPGATKQNASDFALIIEVVELLHQDRFDHAVIVSSDLDFLQLVVYLRERGKKVSVMGEAKTLPSLRSACDDFFVLPVEKTSVVETVTVPKKEKPPSAAPVADNIDRDWLKLEFNKLSNGTNKVLLSGFGQALVKSRKGYRKGYRLLSGYLQASGLFVIEEGHVYLRNV